jgi:bla regulator protein BlaR1
MERLFLECTIRAALLVAGTAAVILVLRVKDAAVKHKIWTGVMVLMLMLPAWTAWGPKASVRLLPIQAQKSTTAAHGHDFLVGIPSKTNSEDFRATPSHVWNWRNVFLGVYLLGFGALLLRLAIGTVRAHKLVCQAVLFEGRLTSSSCAVPVTVGLLHPKVILPEEWRDWPEAKLDAVLTHEREHARRRDPLIKWLALFNRALYWFHPLAWSLESRLSTLAEEACDNLVLSRGHRPLDYSEYLVQMARSVSDSGVRLNIAGVDMPGSSLPKRIRRITEGTLNESISRVRMALLASASAAMCLLLAAGNLDHALASPDDSPQSQLGDSSEPSAMRLKFDSVTIHVNASGDKGPGVGPTTAHTSLGLLMVSAYQLPESQFFGLPDWADSDRFDIQGTVGGNPGPEQTTMMWQSVLADEFKLTMHRETRQLPFYELVMATPGRLGPQLHPNDTKCDPEAAMGTPASIACGRVSLTRTASALRYSGQGMTIHQFVATLAGFGSNEKLDRWGMNRNLDRPIEDRTELKGKFDLELEFAPQWPGFDTISGPSGPPLLFKALEEQLGLRLEPRTGPVDVLVIDYVERPSERNL